MLARGAALTQEAWDTVRPDRSASMTTVLAARLAEIDKALTRCASDRALSAHEARNAERIVLQGGTVGRVERRLAR